MPKPLSLALTATLLLVLVVAFLTLVPHKLPGGPPGSDKRNHLLAFAALAFPLALVRPRLIPAVALGLAVFGGAIEIIQPYVGRGRELADWIADLLGIVTGSALGLALHRPAWRIYMALRD